MCDRYSHRYGYLCNDCFEELVAKGEGVDVHEFLNTPPTPVEKKWSRDKWDEEFAVR
jgi:hypothetical protein